MSGARGPRARGVAHRGQSRLPHPRIAQALQQRAWARGRGVRPGRACVCVCVCARGRILQCAVGAGGWLPARRQRRAARRLRRSSARPALVPLVRAEGSEGSSSDAQAGARARWRTPRGRAAHLWAWCSLRRAAGAWRGPRRAPCAQRTHGRGAATRYQWALGAARRLGHAASWGTEGRLASARH